MNVKKSPSKNLENKRIIFFEIGAIITLALVFLAFEWKSYEPYEIERFGREDVVIIDEIMVQTKHEKDVEIPKPKIKINKFIISDNPTTDIEIFDPEIDFNEPLELYHPELPEEPEIKGDDPPLLYSQKLPEFKGGMKALHNYLRENISYPKAAKENGITGKVFIIFVVEKDGSLSNIVLERGIGRGCDEEAMRVVQNMPLWNPGLQNGMPARVQITLPINFQLY